MCWDNETSFLEDALFLVRTGQNRTTLSALPLTSLRSKREYGNVWSVLSALLRCSLILSFKVLWTFLFVETTKTFFILENALFRVRSGQNRTTLSTLPFKLLHSNRDSGNYWLVLSALWRCFLNFFIIFSEHSCLLTQWKNGCFLEDALFLVRPGQNRTTLSTLLHALSFDPSVS